MKTSFLISRLLLALVFTCCAYAVKADPITLTMNNTASGEFGQTITFQGILSNLGTPTVFLNSLSFTASAGLSVNTAPFFALAGTLAPGQNTGIVSLFTVTVGALPIGTYLGSITILGGGNADAANSLLTRDFQIVVTPEPGTLLLLGSGLLSASLLRRRQRARR